MTTPAARTPLWPIVIVALLTIQFLVGTECLVRPVVVSGPSMEPVLQHGDRVFVDVWTYRQRAPRADEILVIEAPGLDRALLVKRVGRPGDRLAERGDRSPGGSLWVEGDNRRDSLDSRQLGELRADGVTGRVVWRYWPPSRWGAVR